MQLSKPKNQFALAVWLLIEHGSKGVTMKVCMEYWFHKFQSRLGEIERAHPKLKIRRLPITTKNRFGHICTYTNYKSVSPYPYLRNLFEYLNKHGLKENQK